MAEQFGGDASEPDDEVGLRAFSTARWVGKAEFDVLGMADRLVEHGGDVLVVEGVADVSSLAPTDDESEVAQQPQLVADG